MPMPRLTSQPSGMSCAARAAMPSRLRGVMAGSAMRGSLRLIARWHIAIRNVQYAIDEDPRGLDRAGFQLAQFGGAVGLGDSEFCSHRHHRIEILLRLPIDQVAPA